MFAALTLIGLVLLLETAGSPPPASPPSATLRIQDRLLLSLSPAITMAGRNVRTTVRVDRHAANRWLRIAIDGPFYAASTERQLDGDEAARTFEMMWQSLPAGEYMVTAEVEGARGVRHRQQRLLTVKGMTDDRFGTQQPAGVGRRASEP
jgi:hypothetical protein